MSRFSGFEERNSTAFNVYWTTFLGRWRSDRSKKAIEVGLYSGVDWLRDHDRLCGIPGRGRYSRSLQSSLAVTIVGYIRRYRSSDCLWRIWGRSISTNQLTSARKVGLSVTPPARALGRQVTENWDETVALRRGETMRMKKQSQDLIAKGAGRSSRVEITIGIDLGDIWSHYCTLNQEGEVVDRGRFRTTPSGVERWFTDLPSVRIRDGSRNTLDLDQPAVGSNGARSDCGERARAAGYFSQ
jgi:hypothetical protein